MVSISRWGYIGGAWLFLAGVIYQVLLAGLSLFDSTSYWATHIDIGYSVGMIFLPLLAFGLLGKIPRSLAKWLAVTLVIYVVQTILPVLRGPAPLLAALHPLNAMLLVYLSAVHALRAYRLLRPAQARSAIADTSEAEHAHLGAP